MSTYPVFYFRVFHNLICNDLYLHMFRLPLWTCLLSCNRHRHESGPNSIRSRLLTIRLKINGLFEDRILTSSPHFKQTTFFQICYLLLFLLLLLSSSSFFSFFFFDFFFCHSYFPFSFTTSSLLFLLFLRLRCFQVKFVFMDFGHIFSHVFKFWSQIVLKFPRTSSLVFSLYSNV